MIISLNWLKKFTDITVPIEELSVLIGSRLVEIENVIDFGAKYQGIVIAAVKKVEKHPNADKLHVVEIDDGGVTKNVDRLDNGCVQVVCGAPNVREGIKVAWLPPGTTVPESYEKEALVLEARELRGVISNGMLASARELMFGDDHSGIVEIDVDVDPGTTLGQAYELDDYLLDIENKSLTHRPDCFGLIGFAREVAAIQGKTFVTPEWLKALEPVLSEAILEESIKPPTVVIDDTICSRYEAVVVAGVDAAKQSPLQVRTYLARSGMRPINAVVDTTNYLMLLTGQPLHAFDYDKFVKTSSTGHANIVVRTAKKDEKLKLLDGREVTLNNEDIVICAGDIPVALGGAMGGDNTEVDANTKNLLIESASFDLYKLRNTQMRHGIFSEAITRYTKGQPAAQTAPVLASAVRMLCDVAGGKRASDIIDIYPTPTKTGSITLTLVHVNDVLGLALTSEQVSDILARVELECLVSDQTLEVVVPFWRADLHIPEDIIEEIARINGYDQIEPTLPLRSLRAHSPSDFKQFKDKLSTILASSGANEVLSYSFVPGDLLQKTGQKIEDSYKIVNAISPRLQYYRQTLTPSLLELVRSGGKAGYDEFALFEFNKTHNKVHGNSEDGLPGEVNILALVYASQQALPGAPFFTAKRYLDFVATKLGLTFVYKPFDVDPGYPVTAPFDYQRSAQVIDKASGEFIGMIGEYHRSVIKALKLPTFVAGFEIGPEALAKAVVQNGPGYVPLSKYPGTTRDVCFRVSTDVAYQSLIESLEPVMQSKDLDMSFVPLDIYQRPGDTSHKQITLRVSITDHSTTISAERANGVVESMAQAAKQACDGEVI